MKSDRLSRYRRAKDPPRMQLTRRDMTILQLVGLCRFVTRLQVQRYLFPIEKSDKQHSQKNVVTRRLMLLYHNGYVDRLHPPIAAGCGSSPIVYCLERKGASLVEREFGMELPDILFRKGQRERGLLFLQHTLAVNDFRIAIILASRQHGFKILRWLDERSLRKHGAKQGLQEIASAMGKRGGILPDAYFTLDLVGKKASFFLEIDRGHTEGRRIRRKAEIYWRYYDSRLYEQQFGAKSLRVLTVTTSDRRLGNMKAWAEEAKGGTVFWLTTEQLVEPKGVLTKPIWAVAGGGGAVGWW